VTSETLQPLIALVGQRDEPTDALHDYCEQLQYALARRGFALELAEVRWDCRGYLGALAHLWTQSENWTGRWVLMQYTALSWSRHGFPFGALGVLALMRQRRAHCAVVFHDAQAFPGLRAVDRFRRACQLWTMRQAYRMTYRSIFTTPVENIAWLPKGSRKARFVPIGPNIPEFQIRSKEACRETDRPKTVAVFGVTGGEQIAREVREIAQAVRHASDKNTPLRLNVLGRNSKEAEPLLRRALEGVEVAVTTQGVISTEQIASALCSSDVLLFVRGPVANTRGSAIAGIACGLPIVGYAGPETAFPITEAGLQLVPYGKVGLLSRALDRVLSDDQLRQDLRLRSLSAYTRYFSWDRIAEQYVAALGNE
jgi:glycosyltransferase involved in cell wall biosynthesis